MRRTVLALTYVLGCFSDPPPVDASTGSSTGNGSTSAQSTDPTTSSDATPTTTAPPPDTSAGESTEQDTGSTGVPRTCDNGSFEAGELCIDDVADFELQLGAPIRDIALGGIDDAFGDGAIVGLQNDATWLNWWLWDGGPAGPQVQSGYTTSGMFAPLGAALGDVDGVPGDEIVFGSAGQLQTFVPMLEVTVFCNFTPPLSDFTLAQLDNVPGLEVVGTHSADPFGLTAWVSPAESCTLESDTFRMKTSLLSALERENGPSDLTFTGNGASLAIGEVTTNPFDFTELRPHSVGEGILQMTAGDLDGDGLRDDLVVATNEGIAVLVGDEDGTFEQGEFIAAGGLVVDMAAADLDGDGDEDVAIADASSTIVTLLLSDGAGSLAYAAGPDIPAEDTAIAVADTNGDTAPDIVVGFDDGTVRWYLSDP